MRPKNYIVNISSIPCLVNGNWNESLFLFDNLVTVQYEE